MLDPDLGTAGEKAVCSNTREPLDFRALGGPIEAAAPGAPPDMPAIWPEGAIA